MKTRRIMLCLFLALIMTVTFIPTFAFAEDGGYAMSKASDLSEQTESSDVSEYAEAESDNLNAAELESDFTKDIEIEQYDLYIGDAETGTVPAGTAVMYQVQNNLPCHIYLETGGAGEDDYLGVCVYDENFNIKENLSADDLFDGYSSGYDEDAVSVIYNECWDSFFYTLSDGDYIALIAGDADIDYSMMVQEVVTPMYYWYGDFDYGYLYNEAQLIPIELDANYQKNAVMYLENNTYTDFSYYMVSGDGLALGDTDGDYLTVLESDYYVNAGYNFNTSENYYLLIFSMPGQSTGYYYDEWPYYADEDDYDYALAVTPQNLKYYTITGIKNKTYTGKALKASIDAEYRDVILDTDDYSVSYSNNINVGTATVTLKGRHPQNGSIKKTFKINPKGTSLSSVKAAKKAFTVKWAKQATKMSKARITGYQIQYSTNSKFKSGNKLVTVKGYKSTSKKIKKLKKKKKYYVRVRTYMNVSGKTYYSGWSKTKAVKTR